MSIDISNFRAWKEDEVTKAIFKTLQECRESIEYSMINADVILAPNSDKELAKLVGIREGLDLILQITIDDVKEDGEDVNDIEESVETSRT